MSKSSEAVKRWRKKIKSTMIESMGGCCQVCGYNKCNEALELHHLDPSQKDFNFGCVTANPKSAEKIKEELKKCVLICANCHREVHNNVTEIPKDYKILDEKLFIKLNTRMKKDSKCPVCGKSKPTRNKTCSCKCSATLSYSIDWDKFDLVKLLKENDDNRSVVADIVGCSDGAIIKRMKKLGIYTPKQITKTNKCIDCSTIISKKSKRCVSCYREWKRKYTHPN